MTQFFDSLWAWLVANQATFLTIFVTLLPTLIVATSHHPKVQGLLKLVAELIDRCSGVQHSNSQPRKFFGHFKLPGMRSLPPVGEAANYPSIFDDLRKRLCKCPTPPAPGPVPVPSPAVIAKLMKIAVVDFGGTGVDPADVVKYAAAQQRQINEQFALPPPVGWGIAVQYVRACKPSEVLPDEAVIGLYATADQPGALGYHDKTPSGMPVGHVFPPLDKADGVPWQTTASHEALELLGDPELTLAYQRSDTGAFVAAENCDAVEQDTYQIDGVPLSNWCTQLWFSPPANTKGAKYDWLGLCKSAFEVRSGGYMQTWSDQSGWGQTFGQKEPPRAYRQIPRTSSRASRRAAKTKKLAA